MVTIELTTEEAQILNNLMAECISDLRMEISDTDRHDYKEMLKHREELLKKMLAQLNSQLVEKAS